MVYLAHPFGVGGDGRTATSGVTDHVRDLVEQVLATAPGERVNRPDFGSGLLSLVFEPHDDALAAAGRAQVEGALHRWLGEVIQLEAVTVQSIESTLEVQVRYVIRATGERTATTFRGPVT
ncbi:GPW/gp25 family protein [Streptomyces sp. NPDC059900]|uniref:GPW/gp25 family protein n=1 Tax=Streptomyces sp. NPDC059900 TaxID=3155816 RepID=UPI00343B1275